MVILIGGESHTGKTLLAQRLMERHRIPYTSLDHIKMGLIRGQAGCGFTVPDSDETIARQLWGIVKGIIDTCLENNQHIILEGCYLPPDQVCLLDRTQVLPIYLLFSPQYIRNHYADIVGYESVIERRKFPEERSAVQMVAAHARLKADCGAAGLPFVEIREDYEEEMRKVRSLLDARIEAMKQTLA